MFPQDQNSIVDIAKERAKQSPDRNYLHFLQDGDDNEVTLTYQQLDQSCRQIAGWFQQQGIQKGDRIVVILPNSVEFTKIFYSCLYGGFLAVPLSEPAGPKHLQAYLETFIPTLEASEPKYLVTTTPLVQFLTTQLPPPLQSILNDITIISDEELVEQSAEYTDPKLEKTDLAYLQFTSGSTGTPKGIMISHRNLLANMEEARKGCDWKEGKGTALWLPLFHDFGLAAGMIGALYNGGFVVLMTPAHFIVKPIRWLKAITKYQCSYSYSPPFGYDLCLKKVSEEEKKSLDLSSLICAVNGAEPVHYENVKEFNDYFADCGLQPNAIRPGFGMAETVIMFALSPSLHGLLVNKELLETQGKIEFVDQSEPVTNQKQLVNLGKNMDFHELVIQDLETKEALPEGKIGEILIHGPSVCEGYFRNPEATKEVFEVVVPNRAGKNFLKTGDTGLLWEGNLYFASRIKDLIIIRGRNYYPHDFENALTEIKELRAGCIVAYPTIDQDRAEALAIAMEIQKDLLKDARVFQEYILPTIDQKVTSFIMDRFQLHVSKRLYLQPGVIQKTSSGKIKHQKNQKIFESAAFEGLLAQLPQQEETIHDIESNLQKTIFQLFQKIVQQDPDVENPIFALGVESLVILDFLETVQEKYPVFNFDWIEETSTLQDVIRWLEENIE